MAIIKALFGKLIGFKDWFLKASLVKKIVILAFVVGIGWFSIPRILGTNNDQPQYQTAQAEKGTLITSIEGSGQVSPSNQVDVKPKVSAEIVSVDAVLGEKVAEDTVLVRLDDAALRRQANQARASYDAAKANLVKAEAGATGEEIATAQRAVDSAQITLEREKQDLIDAQADADRSRTDVYNDARGALASAELDSTSAMQTMNAYYDPNFSYEKWWTTGTLYVSLAAVRDAETEKVPANAAHGRIRTTVNGINAASSYEAIDTALAAVQSDLEIMLPAAIATYDALQMNADKTTAKSAWTTLISSVGAVRNQRETIASTIETNIASLSSANNAATDAETKLKTAKEDLSFTTALPTTTDSASLRASLSQAAANLDTAEENLANALIRTPGGGIVAALHAKKGTQASTSDVVATIIAEDQLAEISLNEIDVAQIKIGQKATLTFDAVPDLTITGEVAEIDAIGTASQGVVTYNVKIAFDTQDERVKPSMSVSASIVTEAKADVLLVPNSAVKSQSGMSYVEIPADEEREMALTANIAGVALNSAPRRQPVQVGISNDQFTEITEGLNEGDPVVTRTIQASTAQTGTQSPQNGIPGLPGGGAIRSGGGGGGPVMITH